MKCLADLGITRTDVRLALINQGIQIPQKEAEVAAPRYICGDQRQVWERIRQTEPIFYALALMDYPAAVIGAITGVSGECVLLRLRKVGLTKRGRPRTKNRRGKT